MRILLLNPNTTEALTAMLAAAARAVAPPDVEIVAVTAASGFPYISSRAEAQIAGAQALETVAAHMGRVDAVVIAAFGDPGLHAARELFDIPVVGMTEAAMLTACALGERFAFVTFTPRLAPWFAAQVRQAGLESRFAGVRAATQPIGALDAIAGEMRAALIEQCRLAAVEDGADVVIPAGAPLAGMAAGIADEIPATPLDPIGAAVLQAASLARLAPAGAARGSFARPPEKRGTGLPPALAAWIARAAPPD